MLGINGLCSVQKERNSHPFSFIFSSQIDCVLCRRKNVNGVKNCKVIYREHIAKQHKVVVVLDREFKFKKKRVSEKGTGGGG